jgi:hypothetical protein
MVCADGEIEIAARFVEHQAKPDCDEAGCHPRIHLVGVRQVDVNVAQRMQLSQPIARVV